MEQLITLRLLPSTMLETAPCLQHLLVLRQLFRPHISRPHISRHAHAPQDHTLRDVRILQLLATLPQKRS